MFMQWEYILLGVAAVVALPYVLGPFAVKAAMKFNPRPLIQKINPETEAIPEQVRAYCYAAHEQFTRLGFEAAPLLRIDGIVPNMHCYAALFVRRSDGQQALAAVNFAVAAGKTQAKPGYTEFSSDFKNGGSVMTNDSTEMAFGPTTANVTVVKAPWVESVPRLLELHKEACRRFGTGEPKRDSGPGWEERALIDSLDKFVHRGVEHGFFYASADGTYRLTWKGAIIGTYTNLPPGSWIVRRRMYAVGRELMRFVPGAV